MGPFDRFTDRAKRVLALAQDEAIRFDHNYIGPEHLVLGLVREAEGVAARVLDSLGIELSKLRTAIEFLVGRGDASRSPSEVTLHPRTKKIIELAIDEARRLGHPNVNTEHLLLGVLREGESVAVRALESCGATTEKTRLLLMNTISQVVPPPQVGRVQRPRFGRGAVAIHNVVTLAREEALGLGHDWIGTEHLLLALLRPTMPFSLRPLLALGVTYEKARAEVVANVPQRDSKPANAELTPRAYEIIGYANGHADLAPGLDGSRAVLVALVANEEGIAAGVLRKLGASADKIFEAMDST